MTDDGRTVEGGRSPAETARSNAKGREGYRRLPGFEFWNCAVERERKGGLPKVTMVLPKVTRVLPKVTRVLHT